MYCTSTATQLSTFSSKLLTTQTTLHILRYKFNTHTQGMLFYFVCTVIIGILTLNTLSIPDNTHNGAS